MNCPLDDGIDGLDEDGLDVGLDDDGLDEDGLYGLEDGLDVGLNDDGLGEVGLDGLDDGLYGLDDDSLDVGLDEDSLYGLDDDGLDGLCVCPNRTGKAMVDRGVNAEGVRKEAAYFGLTGLERDLAKRHGLVSELEVGVNGCRIYRWTQIDGWIKNIHY